jgi:hypothetical protein
MLNTLHPQVYIVISPWDRLFPLVKEVGMKFYFSNSYPVTSYRLLEENVQTGVSDIYIADDLCYDLANVRKACDKFGVRLRMVLNRIPSQRFDKGLDVKSPFFLPEFAEELGKYVDVGEFVEEQSWSRLETYYKIWFKNEKWRENLNYIYPELEIDIYNRSMIPLFQLNKMNCRYRCAYGSSCRKCEQFVEMAATLNEKHIEFDLNSIKKKENNDVFNSD